MPIDLNRSLYMLRNGSLYKTCPSCSVAYGQDVYYNCPEYFGYRHDDGGRAYSQSLCMRCRGHKKTPEVLYDGNTFLQNSDIVVPEIRILPLSQKVFNSYDEVRTFFLKEVPSRGNTYYYKSHNLSVKENTIILFQYNGSIIGYALYSNESTISQDDSNYAEGYRGYYVFVENSIKLLSTPISSDIIFEKFSIKLSQATSRIKISYLPILMELLDEGYEEELYEINKNVEEKTIKEISHFSIIGIHNFGSRNNAIVKDYVKAHKNQIAVGVLGETLILKYEKEKLLSIGRKDLSEKVTIVSSDASLGYDILSFDNNGNEIHIEVKSKASKLKYFDFYISDNEYQKLKFSSNHVIYYLSNLRSETPFLFKLTGDMINDSNIKPVLYRVTLDYEIESL